MGIVSAFALAAIMVSILALAGYSDAVMGGVASTIGGAFGGVVIALIRKRRI